MKRFLGEQTRGINQEGQIKRTNWQKKGLFLRCPYIQGAGIMDCAEDGVLKEG